MLMFILQLSTFRSWGRVMIRWQCCFYQVSECVIFVFKKRFNQMDIRRKQRMGLRFSHPAINASLRVTTRRHNLSTVIKTVPVLLLSNFMQQCVSKVAELTHLKQVYMTAELKS